MRDYIIRRLLLFLPSLFLVSVVIFVLMRIVPGDPALVYFGDAEFTEKDYQRVRALMGLDKPIHLQYIEWIGNTLRLNLGTSLRNQTDIWETLRDRIPISMELAFFATSTAVVIALPIGVISALRQDTPLDYVVRVFAILGLTLPTFWIGTLTILVLSRYFDWLPAFLYTAPWEDPLRNLSQLIWPIMGLGFYFNGVLTRMTRAQMLEVMRQDYIRTAWAKGLRERVVIFRHALRNACLPVITVAGMQLSHLLGGSVVMESIFAIPGLGRLFLESLFSRDYPVIQAIVLFFAVLYLTMNLLVDLTYGWLDPRIRYR